MIRKWFAVTALVLTASALLSLSSCARDQKLQGIVVSPSTVTFGGVGAQVQFRAVGSYIHPPENKDITDKVTWSIDSQNLVTFDGPGLVTAISDCGTGNVTASFQDGGNYVSGSAFVSAAGVGTSACTQATLTVALTGTGSVTSSPAGITCPGTCTAGFGLDETVVLTGTPTAPATSVTWGANCTPNGNTCSVSLNTNETVTATFQ
jgi:hypothetical protein